jgi:hypothetical protein
VLVVRYNGGHSKKAAKIRQWAKRKEEESHDWRGDNLGKVIKIPDKLTNPEEAYRIHFKEWQKIIKASNKSSDTSRGDFSVACEMLKEGYLSEQIITAMIEQSPAIEIRKASHIRDYAMRTVKAGERILSKLAVKTNNL